MPIFNAWSKSSWHLPIASLFAWSNRLSSGPTPHLAPLSVALIASSLAQFWVPFFLSFFGEQLSSLLVLILTGPWPSFSLVNTKFDNRVKELRSPEAASKYMTGENLPEGKRPFFISLPVRRNLDSERFRESIKDCYLDDYRRLLEIKFDEETYDDRAASSFSVCMTYLNLAFPRFAEQVGFHRVKAYLERMLTEKYYASVPPTLHMLDNICKESERVPVASPLLYLNLFIPIVSL